MTYDHELILIRESITYDDLGNAAKTTEEIPVLCSVQSVGRNEFYSAANAGLKPELVFVVKNYEYQGEPNVKFDGQKYRVIRTYTTGFEEIELTCEKVIGNG